MNGSIIFVLGAGFSAPFDVPTMRPFLRSFQDVAERKYPDLQETLQRHFLKLPDDSDIEALLTSLSLAETVKDSLPPTSTISEELDMWEKESHYLKAHLVSYIIERCERFDRDRASEVLSPLISKLHGSSAIQKVHLFTTNYDRIIEYVCESINIDFSDGFGRSGRELAAPWKREFSGRIRLYKLHGSVTYYVDRKSRYEPIFLRLDRGYPLPSPEFRLTREGRELEPLMVLPTMEKDTLSDPYGYLNHLFTQTMSETRIVVMIGTSLRDNHLVSAINYNSNNVVVLLIDTDPAPASDRIPGVACIKLRASAENFLKVSTERLILLFEQCIEETNKEKIIELVEGFAENEVAEISQWISMTEVQREALNTIRSDKSISDVLMSIQRLHGIAHSDIIEAVASKCLPGNPGMIRKAAAGCLGLSGNPAAVTALESIVTEDNSTDVRLEGYLALKRLGTDDALEALEAARHRWPEDTYFEMYREE